MWLRSYQCLLVLTLAWVPWVGRTIAQQDQLGDLWHLGPHRVLCADATSPEAVSRLLGERRPRLLVTDPPYGIELDSEWRDRAGLNGCGPAEPSYMKKRNADLGSQ